MKNFWKSNAFLVVKRNLKETSNFKIHSKSISKWKEAKFYLRKNKIK